MNIDNNGIILLADLEGVMLKAYKCTAGVWTIGLGNTFYANGTKVKEGDVLKNKDEAYALFHLIAPTFEKAVNDNVTSKLKQNQFNALFCFAYNVGTTAFKKSTLLRMVNKNKDDVESILNAFHMWDGKNNVLRTRQTKQVNHYFL